MVEQTLKTAPAFLLQTKMTAEGGVAGRINSVSNGEAVLFTGLDQAVLMMNEWMDKESPLPPDALLRTFRTERGRRAADGRSGDGGLIRIAASEQSGGIGRRETFLVRIICRQYNSWQGEVCWRAQRLYFRSALEFMYLIHSALDPGAAKAAVGSAFRAV